MSFSLSYREAMRGVSPHLEDELDRLITPLQRIFTRGTALTASNTGTINSGDATTDAVIASLRTRVNELEALLQTKGFL